MRPNAFATRGVMSKHLFDLVLLRFLTAAATGTLRTTFRAALRFRRLSRRHFKLVNYNCHSRLL